MKKFPEHRSHEGARRTGCFNCKAPLNGHVIDEGYSRGHGQFSQRCTGRCKMKTCYDLTRVATPRSLRETHPWMRAA